VFWIRLAQDGSQAVVKMVMKLCVHKECREFIDHLRDYQLLKKDSAPWSYLQ